ncbi:hypothetical protein F4825DRAFT_457967 [Nemania diffusa]|nr:hypothetical protein F4825DRAFT_457967 [Nemania diffusa]
MALIILRQSPPGADPASPPPVALSADPFAAIIAITVVMSVIVLAKAWAKVVVVKQFGLEDWSALIGSSFVIAETGVLASILRDGGLDSSHAVASPLTLYDPIFQGRLFVLLILAGVPLAFAKLSILILLLKIFPRRARPTTAYFIWAAITFTTLQMSTRLKIGVTAIFAMGFLALAASAIVLYTRLYFPSDPSEVWIQILTPTVLLVYEPAIALITACLPTMPSLWGHILKTHRFQSLRRLLSRVVQRSRPSNGTFALMPDSSRNSIHLVEHGLRNSVDEVAMANQTAIPRRHVL